MGVVGAWLWVLSGCLVIGWLVLLVFGCGFVWFSGCSCHLRIRSTECGFYEVPELRRRGSRGRGANREKWSTGKEVKRVRCKGVRYIKRQEVKMLKGQDVYGSKGLWIRGQDVKTLRGQEVTRARC